MRFGGLLAVNGVKLDVNKGEVISIIGPNGAGKTTIFNCLTGFYRPSGGVIRYKGEEIQGLPGHLIARKGIVRTFQHVRLFKEMTAVENLLVAQHRHLNTGFLAGLFKTPAFRRAEREGLEQSAFWLEKVGLKDLANSAAGNLAYGQQRRLEIARALVTRPKFLLLDEPFTGVDKRSEATIVDLLRTLAGEGRTVMVSTHMSLPSFGTTNLIAAFSAMP